MDIIGRSAYVLPKVHILSDMSLVGAHGRRAFDLMRLLGLWLFFIPSLLHLLIHSFIHYFTHFSFFASSSCSFIHFIRSFICSFTFILLCFILLFIHFIHAFPSFILHSFFASQPPSGNPICLDKFPPCHAPMPDPLSPD